jgi:predicted amidophosphoribosyltransferase
MGGVMVYLDAAADYWLGSALPPAEQVIAEADWEPDESDAYCGRCGDSVGPGEATETGCAACRGRPPIADGFVRIGPYSGDLRTWIMNIKYQQRWAEMAQALGRRLGRAVADAGTVDLDRTVVVPMPMPWQRRLYRRIDHARVIAAALARELQVPLADVLKKAGGPPQVSRPASLRARTGARGLAVRRRLGGWNLADLHVIVADDVRTTGASMRAAVRILRRLKPRRVVAAVVAVSDDAARRDRRAGAAGRADPTLRGSGREAAGAPNPF